MMLILGSTGRSINIADAAKETTEGFGTIGAIGELTKMVTRDLVVVGASAGGIAALQALAAGLPPDFGAAVLVVQHLAPRSPGYLADILDRAGPLPARFARSGQDIVPGAILVAPPDRHLLVEAGMRAVLSRGPKENRSRPAVDPLFRSAAVAFGARVIGVVMSGYLDDGTVGLQAIKLCRGLAIVQDPSDAEVPAMPLSAIRHVSIDHRVPAQDIGPLLTRLTREPVPPARPVAISAELRVTNAVAGEMPAMEEIAGLGDASAITCPDCQGTLFEFKDEHPLHFRCHTGHAYTALSLLEALRERSEEAIWSAVRVWQEQTILASHMRDNARAAGDEELSAELEDDIASAKSIAEKLREVQSAALER